MAPAADFVMPFGKHKGKPLSAVPRGYLHWALENVQGMYPDTRAAIETYVGTPKLDEPSNSSNPSPRRPRVKQSPATAATCGICGLAGTKDRPLVHASCASEDVPF